jgi:hypothetical protein
MLLPQEAVLAVRYSYEQLIVRTGSDEGELVPAQEVSLHDITPQVRELVRKAGIVHGTVNLISQHTTTTLTVNEYESRLLDDVRQIADGKVGKALLCPELVQREGGLMERLLSAREKRLAIFVWIVFIADNVTASSTYCLREEW